MDNMPDGAAAAVVVCAGAAAQKLFDAEDLEGLLAAEAELAAAGDEATVELRSRACALSPEEHEGLWYRIREITQMYLKVQQHTGPDGQVDATAERTVHAVALLLAAFADGALDAKRDAALPPAFVDVASSCQELLLSVRDGRTQALIAQALERICTGSFEGREDFYGGVLMYLIGKCVGPKTTAADAARLYKVRHLLGELDWEHDSIESLKMQLMRCAASPSFARSQHGSDMLALFYTVHPGFTTEVHSTVKNQVLYSRPLLLKAYAVGLFKAWKAAEGGTRVQVEHCVQDWVVLAILSCPKSADRARAMLEELHRHHLEAPVNELLCRLYGPVLWRSLKVANSQVRQNAARLLQYVFPLLPGDMGVAEKEQETAKQLRLLRETLEDPSEPVRRVGISAVCVILKNYWDMLPPAEIAEMLTVLMNKCAHDKKAPKVRAAVAEGFAWILENVLSHQIMAAVLPQTAELLSDKSPIVRAAFINMLNVVSTCRAVSINTIVNNEALLMRLAAEHTEAVSERLHKNLQPSKKSATCAEERASPELVAKLLTKLMVPSLFQQDLQQQVARCNYLMQNWPLALLALLTHVRDFVPTPERVKLAAALFRYGLREAANAAAASKGSNEERPPQMVATMLRVVGVLLEGAVEPIGKRGKKKGSPGGGIPKELEKFVYEHIKEVDFLDLLKAPHEDSGVAARLRNDLLFALSALDPAKLPRTAQLVHHELSLACRGGIDSLPTIPRLTALMRTAVGWRIIDSALEPAWERLQAAAKRLERRQPATDDTDNAVKVTLSALQDRDVRSAMLLTKKDILTDIVEAVSGAFCSAWSAGVTILRSPSAGASPTLLGPATEVWPRFIGLAIRLALHIEYRSCTGRVAAVLDDAEKSAAGQVGTDDIGAEAADEECAEPDEEGAEPAQQPVASGLAQATLAQVGAALTSGPVVEVLESLEAAAAARGAGAKKRVKGLPMPVDIDIVLQVHQRVLEALNVQHHLSALKRSATESKDGASTPMLARTLEDHLWRWAHVADALRPLEEGPRVPGIWALLGRFLQQIAYVEVSTPDVILAARRLLERTTDEVPSQESGSLKQVLHALFEKMEYEPQLAQFVVSIVGNPDDQADSGAAAGLPIASAEVGSETSTMHPRVKAAMLELIPSFRHLGNKFLRRDEAAVDEDAELVDKRRIFASPTPQKAGRVPDATLDEQSDAACRRKGDSRRTSRKSRSRSPAEVPDSTSACEQGYVAGPPSWPSVSSEGRLFKSCFDGARASTGSVGSKAPSVRSAE